MLLTPKIKDLRIYLLSGFFQWIIVEVITDSGISGWGEAYKDLGAVGALEGFKETIIGEDATNINAVLNKLRRRWSGGGIEAGAASAAL